MCKQFFLNGITLPQLAEALAPLLQKTVKEPQQETKDLIGREEACSFLHCNITYYISILSLESKNSLKTINH